MYSNNVLDFQESKTILNVCTKMSGNLLKAPRVYIYIYIYIRFLIEVDNLIIPEMNLDKWTKKLEN